MATLQQGGIATDIHGFGGDGFFRGGSGMQVVPLTQESA
jgi:hypothetical protein